MHEISWRRKKWFICNLLYQIWTVLRFLSFSRSQLTVLKRSDKGRDKGSEAGWGREIGIRASAILKDNPIENLAMFSKGHGENFRRRKKREPGLSVRLARWNLPIRRRITLFWTNKSAKKRLSPTWKSRQNQRLAGEYFQTRACLNEFLNKIKKNGRFATFVMKDFMYYHYKRYPILLGQKKMQKSSKWIYIFRSREQGKPGVIFDRTSERKIFSTQILMVIDK